MIGNFVASLVGTVLNSATVAKYAKFKFDFMQWLILPAASGVYTGFMTYFTYNFCIRLSVAPIISIIIAVLFSIVIYASILELRNISIVKYILKLKTQE